MQSKLVFSLLIAFITGSQAFIPPANLPDGGYLVSTDAAGESHITALGNSTTIINKPPKISSIRSKRQLPSPSEGCTNNDLDSAYPSAQSQLGAWCDSGNQVPPKHKVFFKSGNSVAYICCYGG